MVNIRISMFFFITCRGRERDWFNLPGDRAEENLATERPGAENRSALFLPDQLVSIVPASGWQ